MASTTTYNTVKKTGYTTSGEKVANLSVALQTGSDRGLYAQWKHKNSGRASGYEYDWEYATGARNSPTAAQRKKGQKGSLKWFPGSHGTVDKAQAQAEGGWFRCTYTAPNSATQARVRVRPKSTTRNVTVSVTETYKDGKLVKSTNNNASKPYFTSTWSSYSTHNFNNDALAAPTVAVEMASNGTTATVTVTSSDLDTDYCDVQCRTKSGSTYKTASSKLNQRCDGTANIAFKGLKAGTTYYFRAKVQTTKAGSNKTDSAWSAYVSTKTKPAVPKAKSAAAASSTSASFKWDAAAGASTYTAQYVEGSKDYFDTNPSAVVEQDELTGTAFTPTGLEENKQYFFRVKAVNVTGESGWSSILSCKTAVRPSAPTTFETEGAYTPDDSPTLRWQHNASDGSDQTAYQVQIDIYAPDGVGTGAIKTVSDIDVNASDGNFAIPADFAGIYSSQPQSEPFEDAGGSVTYSFKCSKISGVHYSLCPPEDMDFDTSNNVGNMSAQLARYSAETFGTLSNIKIKGLRYYSDHSTQTLSGTTAQYAALPLADIPDGSEVRWKVRTKGAHADWSPWSATRSFAVYEQPALALAVRQTDAEGADLDLSTPLESYPLCIVLDASGGGGAVTGYHVVISAGEAFDYTDSHGFPRWIAAGETIFEADLPTSEDPCTLIIGTADARLYDGAAYNVDADVTMASGLRGSSETQPFAVAFDADVPDPSATVTFDPDTLTADIVPECLAVDEYGELTGGYQEGVTLSVYRIEPDGALVLLRDGIPNDGTHTVTDPHAPFRECWYHVVATDADTGITSFADFYDESPHGTCVIQWDEKWQSAGVDDEGDAEYAYDGSMLDEIYSLDFTEQASVEEESVEYIGRSHPVSYYGTQKGHTARYQVKFPKQDAVALSKVRALMALLDDCYIREPSGTGFWAHLSNVSVGRPSEDGVITVSIDAEQVDRSDSALEEGE